MTSKEALVWIDYANTKIALGKSMEWSLALYRRHKPEQERRRLHPSLRYIDRVASPQSCDVAVVRWYAPRLGPDAALVADALAHLAQQAQQQASWVHPAQGDLLTAVLGD